MVYRTSDERQRREAHDWLVSFQAMSEAWQRSRELLGSAHAEAAFFGASTLYFKVRSEWRRLEPAQQDALRGWLFELVAQAQAQAAPGDGRAFVRAKLNQALGAMCVQALATRRWPDLVPQLLAVGAPLAFELLTAAVDELNGLLLPLPQRQAIVQAFVRETPRVRDELLRQPLRACGTDAEMTLQAVMLVTRWIRLGNESAAATLLFEAPPQEPEPLYAALFRLIPAAAAAATPALQGELADALCELYHLRLEAPQLALVVASLLVLRPLLQGGSRLAARVLQSFLEGQIAFVVQGSEEALQVLALMLEALRAPVAGGRELAMLFTDFLIEFSPHLEAKALPRYAGLYVQVVQAVLERARLAAGFESWARMDPLEREELQAFRQSGAEVLRSAIGVLGGALLALLHQAIEQALQQGAPWFVLEVLVWAVAAVAENLQGSAERERLLPALLDRLLALNPPHPQLALALLDLLAELEWWLAGQPLIIDRALEYLLASLATPPLAEQAAHAFHDISQNCAPLLAPHLARLLALAPHLLAALRPLPHARALLAAGLARVALAPESPREAHAAFMQLLQTPLESLIRLAESQQQQQQPPQQAPQAVVAEACAELQVLAACVRALDDSCSEERMEELVPHPASLLLAASWRAIEALLARYGQDRQLQQDTCELLSRVLLSARQHVGAHAGALLQLCVELFQTRGAPASLSVLAELVEVFAETAVAAAFPSLLQVVSACVFAAVTAPNTSLSRLAEPLAGFFALLNALLKHSPEHLLPTPTLEPSVQLAAACFTVPDRDLGQAVTRFITDLQAHADSRFQPRARAVLAQQGEPLVVAVMTAMLSGTNRVQLKSQAEILYCLLHAGYLSHEAAARCIAPLVERLEVLEPRHKECAMRGLFLLGTRKNLFRSFVIDLANAANLHAGPDFLLSYDLDGIAAKPKR
jgi:hypothetical protein